MFNREDVDLGIEYLRKYTRCALGGTAVFETAQGFCFGGVVNSSMGGVFFEPNTETPDILEGDEFPITLDDIFSDSKCAFDARVMRKSGDGIAFKFTSPLSAMQKEFLQNWFSLLSPPGSEMEH